MAVAASLLLEYVSRSLRWPIPRALKELLLSPHCLKESPRWLYSSRRCDEWTLRVVVGLTVFSVSVLHFILD
uniref:Uncharacterized protein n=1 Tax=Oryza glumipatula TaxID=40148 RepID=A0A0E0B0U5_9ORYZ